MCCCFCFFPFRGEKELLSGYLTSNQTSRERGVQVVAHMNKMNFRPYYASVKHHLNIHKTGSNEATLIFDISSIIYEKNVVITLRQLH